MASLTLDHETNTDYEELAAHGVKFTTIDLVGGILCKICNKIFTNKREYDAHYTEHNTGSSEIIYTCVKCNRDMAFYPSFRGHCYSVHVIKNRYKCSYCLKFFSKQSILKQHVQAAHLLKCSVCSESFSSEKELETHNFIHKDKNGHPPFKCVVCNDDINTTDDCENHIDEHCMLYYSCPICEESINSTNAIEHISQHFGITAEEEILDIELSVTDNPVELLGGILCYVCDGLFKNKYEFDLHFAQHEGMDALYQCNICAKEIDTYKSFHNHCYNHVAKNRFECDQCDKAFPRLSMLVIHAMSHSRQGAQGGQGGQESLDVKFHCGQCARSYCTERRLAAHLREAHHALVCSHQHCDQTFESVKDLQLHEKLHTGTQMISCKQCGLPFASLASCTRHLHVHRKKQYSCPVCARKYVDKLQVTKHISQHFETVLHVCKVCGKVYNARHRFIQHVKTHSKVKNHQCQICGKGFDKPYRLQDHLNMHTGKKPHQCKFCEKTFACAPNLSKHMSRMHRGLAIKTKNVKVQVMETTTVDMIESDSMESDNVAVGQDWEVLEEAVPILDDTIVGPDVDVNAVDGAFDIPGNYNTPAPQAPLQPLDFPQEYGPEFINVGHEVGSHSGDLIDLDDHILPHIDPHLTIKPADIPELDYTGYNTMWEPKIYQEMYPFEEMADTTRLTVLKGDIF